MDRRRRRLGPSRLRPERSVLILVALLLAFAVVASGCVGGSDATEEMAGSSAPQPEQQQQQQQQSEPESESEPRPLTADEVAIVDAYVERISARIYDPVNLVDAEVIDDLGRIADPRLAWLIADGLRFVGRGPEFEAMVRAGSSLGGIELSPATAWLELNNHLLQTDRAAPPGYREWKRRLFVAVDATWSPFFDDDQTTIDWRFVSFGGVLADRRPFGSTDTCQCIAALDDPPALAVADADWLNDGDTIIGVVVDGAARAYPRHIMETHELVNDELGGERIALAYCTLCGSGQAYRLDPVHSDLQPVVLRTSGLLHRSNKIMFDLASRSMVDTFSGKAWTGPWREAGVELEQIATVTSSWGEWKAAHPETTLMAGLDGDGAAYPLDPLGGRDDGGPIFPIGDSDPRLFPQTDVIGVTADDGRTYAFPVSEARARLREGQPVEFDDVTLLLDGSGLRAIDREGNRLISHQAYWFAWSQFNPETELWAQG